MGRQIKHVSMNIAGALRNFGKRSMAGLITEDNGAEWTDKMVRDYLAECLAKGWRVIPCGDCEGFDYQTGCPGHPIIEDTNE
jgi:hypothetical protein